MVTGLVSTAARVGSDPGQITLPVADANSLHKEVGSSSVLQCKDEILK